MRIIFGVAVGCALLAGCASKNKEAMPKVGPDPAEYAPIRQVEGQVVSVEEALRYVVIDFSFSRLPQPGQELALMRDGNRVGEVRVGKLPSHFRGQMVVADVTAGFAAVGDVARVE